MKKRVFSLLMALLMVITMFPTSAIAVGTGTQQDPYQVGDTVTNDGSAEPEGAKAENTYWARTADVAAVRTTVCQTEEHDHVAAGCTAAIETAACLLEGHPTDGETSFTHEDGTVCTYDGENAQWLTNVEAGYTCGIEAHTHTVEAGCITEVPGYTVWTLTENTQNPPPSNNSLSTLELDQSQNSRAAAGALPIHFFLASPGNITNPEGSYTDYYVPLRDSDNAAWTIGNIKANPAWGTINTQNGIRNASIESDVTKYVASWPNGGYDAFKDFGSVRIDGRTYSDTDYEIKWVSIMARHNTDYNAQNNIGMCCGQYYSYKNEHIHIDGLLVQKIEPGEMEVYKAIPAAAEADTTFHFTLQKMLQPDLTSAPTSADAIDTSFSPMTLTATISAGETEAQITGGSEISFGYYKLTENASTNWENNGIVLTDSRGGTQTVDTDTLYICIAPKGDVLYSTTPNGTYTAMEHVAVQNKRKGVNVTYEWKVFNTDGSVSELPAGAPAAPASESGEYGSQYVYDTDYVDGTSFSDYDNGLLYTFRGWDTYSHSDVFNVVSSVAGYTALDDGDANAANNKTIPLTADTYIYGFWEVSELPPASAHIAVEKVFMLDGREVTAAELENSPIAAAKGVWFRINPGIDLSGDGIFQVDIDYTMIQEDLSGEYKLPVYQYATPFTFTENNADVLGYTRTTDIVVTGDNAKLIKEEGVYAEVELTEVYQGTNVHLGTITYTNSYIKNVGIPVNEYPTLTLVKRATDTGNLQSGAVFTLYSDAACQNAVGTFTTGDDGTVTIEFENIEATNDGKYYLKETAAPTGYLVDNTVYTLTLTSSTQEELRGNEFVNVTTYALAISIPANSDAEAIQNAADEMRYSLNVFNRPILGQVTVKKESTGLDEADKDLMKAALTVHGPITRDAQGKITSLGSEYTLTLDKDNNWTATQTSLPIGEYLIHENMASVHGYTWDMNDVDYGGLAEETYNNITSGIFQVKADSTDIQVTVTNTYTPWATADFYIHKTNPSGANLGGAAFQLYADEACTVKVTDPAITTNVVTATNGIAWFRGYAVPADDADGMVTYYLQETIAPAGYYLSNTVYKVDIKSVPGASGTTFEPKISVKVNGNWVEAPGFDNTSDELPVVNEPVKGQLTITKNMVGAPADLTSVTVYVSGPNRYGKTVELTKENQWKETLTDLALGTYTVTEQDASAPGYDLVTTYTVDGNVTTDKATVILKETVPGLTQSGTVFAGTASVTNAYTKREETVENPTSLTVKKVGENGEALAGAEFTLTRLKDNYAQEHSVVFTTGANGTVTFSFLTGSLANGAAIDGEYTLTETKAPAGYAKSNTVWNITVKEKDGQVTIKLNEDKNVWENIWDWIVGGVTGQQDTYTWENNLLTVKNVELADLTISKTFLERNTNNNKTKTLTPPADAIIEVAVYGSDGKLFRQVELSEANSWTVTLTDIPADTYTIRENSPSLHGYEWKNAEFTVTGVDSADVTDVQASSVKVAVENSEAVNVAVENTYTAWEAVDFYVMKVDADGNPLSGAQFVLKDASGADVTGTYLHIDNTIHTNNGNTTGSGGILHFHNFKVDRNKTAAFTLEETVAPENYRKNPNVFKIVVSHQGNNYDLSITDENGNVLSYEDHSAFFNYGNDVLSVVNEEILADLTIEKTFEGGLKPNSVMVKVNGPKNYENTVVLGVNNGYKVTLEGLPLGQYTVKELDTAHDGYALTVKYNGSVQDHVDVSLTENGAAVKIENIYVQDKHNPASFTVKKVDADDSTKVLEGAVFALFDAEGKQVAENSTNENGEATFGPFTKPAVYTLKEIQAPANYEKTDATWTVTVKDEDGQPRVEVENNLNTNIWDWIVDIITGQTTAAWENNILTVPNTIKLGELVINKVVDDQDDSKHYTGDAYTYTINLDCSDDRFDQTIVLKGGEQKTVQGIPYGTAYTVTEDTTGAAFTSTVDNATGTIAAAQTYVEVANTYKYRENNPGLNLVKVDADTGRPIKGVTFELYYDEACTNYANSGTTDENGKVNIPVHYYDHAAYYLKEVAPAAGYYPNTTVYKVKAETKYVVHNAGEANAYTEKQQILTVEGLGEPTVDANNAISYTYKVKNTAIKPVTITATKVWNDGGYYARPETVTVTLYRDGQQYSVETLSEANGWTYTWSGADFTDEYDWTVDEKVADVPAGYVKSVTNDGDDWTLTNTRTPKNVEISVTKAWKHNGGKNLPESIKITLYKDGEAYETVTLNEANGWSHKWTGLTDVSQWSIDETDVPAGYTKDITVDGYQFTVTNTRTILPVEVSVTKAWSAPEGITVPESVEVVLYRDGEKFDTVKLTAKDNWTHTWKDLTDEYTWSVDEASVPAGYTKNVTASGTEFTITNSLNYKLSDVSVAKVWKGDNVTHPSSVEVTLYRDGEKFDTVKLSADNNWKYVWEDLADAFTWTVDEVSVPAGYTKTVTASGTDFTITNALNYNFIDVSVEKVWYGANVTHPASIDVTLFRNGVAFDTVKLSADNNWKYVWKDLTDDYVWAVDETAVPSGYNKTVKENADHAFVITNTHQDIPKTGDENNLTGMIVLCVIGVLGFLAAAFLLFVPRKKGKYEK